MGEQNLYHTSLLFAIYDQICKSMEEYWLIAPMQVYTIHTSAVFVPALKYCDLLIWLDL